MPEGNTEFQSEAGNPNFHSTRYEWLVVNQGGKNTQFKVEGTINEQGAYKFMVWANDNSPHTFRIKIWSQDGPNEIVVYDNGVGQPLGGGSISIKKQARTLNLRLRNALRLPILTRAACRMRG